MSTHPARRHALHFPRLPGRSNHGIPLANGVLGAQIWQDGPDLIFSLDRADLWDQSPIPEFRGPKYTNDRLAELVEAGDMATIRERFEAPYHRPAPTKLPAGRLVVAGDGGPFTGSLDLYHAVATIERGETRLLSLVDLEFETGLLWGDGPCPAFKVVPPAFGRHRPAEPASSPLSPFGAEDLDYPEPVPIAEPKLSGYRQALPAGSGFAVVTSWRFEEGWRAAWTVAVAETPEAAEARARAAVEKALDQPLTEARDRHNTAWETRWRRTWLAVPDDVIERQWVLDAYKLHAATATGGLPVSLQAQWTTDDGRLPPWKGDYHHDLNTQMTYWPCFTGNQLEAHAAFLEWLWATRHECRRWTRDFFDCPGLNVPMTGDLYNRQLGGWAPYTHSATTGAWLAHHFVRHWRYGRDDAFLRTRAWPYVRECAVFLDALTAKDGAGQRRRLRLSSSPEIGNNAREAWFPTWTNYDLVLTRALFADAMLLAQLCGEPAEATRWRCVLAELPEPALDEQGGFAVAPGIPFRQSHRHFSHQLAVHPLRTVPPEHAAVAATIAGIEASGPDYWMGYTFAWLACLHAYAGGGQAAAKRLHQFARGFTAPNSFHTNGEVGDEQLTKIRFDAFTLEGNCAAMAATQDMLLQSSADTVDLFPAVPSAWENATFQGLLAEGCIEVDATLHGDRVEAELRTRQAATRRVRAFRGGRRMVELRPGEPCRIELSRPSHRIPTP